MIFFNFTEVIEEYELKRKSILTHTASKVIWKGGDPEIIQHIDKYGPKVGITLSDDESDESSLNKPENNLKDNVDTEYLAC